MISSKASSRLVGRCRPLSSKIGRTLRSPVVTSLRRVIAQQRFYTTDRIVALRSGKDKTKGPLPATLYDASRETENCGVGLIASLKSVPTRDIVEKADEMLVRMAHRGGCGCDPASGDGSGESNGSNNSSFVPSFSL
jgi:hypothetical protein